MATIIESAEFKALKKKLPHITDAGMIEPSSTGLGMAAICDYMNIPT